MEPTRIISWNVNGIRAILAKGFLDVMRKQHPDIICVQETKAHPDQVDVALGDFPYHLWSSAVKKGYSGTAIFSKREPISSHEGMDVDEFDQEGRIITAEFEDFWLVNVYVPNAQHELLRLEYKRRWNDSFLEYLKRLEKTKPVIFCGDLNVAHREIDIARPKENAKNPGFTPQERDDFSKQLAAGFVDVWRVQHPQEVKYSWWSYRFSARAKNIGWRIDYVVASKAFMPRIKESFIVSSVQGSDHCPVGVDLR
ncbi:MAG: exodeoxyribonuclease III [Nanoarchaeota archaeon]